MKRKSTNSDFATILSTFLILMFAFVCVGFLFFQTEEFSTGIKTFYVKCNDDTIVADKTNYDIVVGKQYRFEVVNTIDKIIGNESKYTLDIIPNALNDFDFSIDEQSKKYINELTIISGFSIKVYDDYFTFVANNDLTGILQSNYLDKNVGNCPTAIDSGIDYFKMIITSKSDNVVINISFNLISE